jgi:transposase
MSQSKKKRRQWSPKDKLRIVMAGMEPGVEISELCRQEGINPTQYYGWKKQLLNSADAVFGNGKSKRERLLEEDPREKELQRMKSVIAEITAENLELKKMC